MSHTIDYYFTPVSPWTHLGHDRLERIAKAAGAPINVIPVDLGGKVFPVSGGLPLAKRAPQRQAYRLVDLARFRDFHQVPLNLHPKHFPVPPDDAARLIIAVDRHDGSEAAMALTGAVLRAVWVEEGNVSDTHELGILLGRLGLPPQRLEESRSAEVQSIYEANTQRAIDLGVFGAPSYVIEGELFWGQDRLDFVERRLSR